MCHEFVRGRVHNLLRTGGLGLACSMLTACGTIITFQEDAKFDCRGNMIYAGTRRSIDNAVHTLLDIPFSLALDTLALPYTIPKSIWNYYHPQVIDGKPQDPEECLYQAYEQ